MIILDDTDCFEGCFYIIVLHSYRAFDVTEICPIPRKGLPSMQITLCDFYYLHYLKLSVQQFPN